MNSRYRAVFGGVLCLIGAGLLLHTFDPHYEDMGIGAEFGPMFYPRILLVLWVGLSIGLVVEPFLGKESDVPRQRWGRLVVMLALVAACTFLLTEIGFLFATVLFCLTASYFMGYRGPIGLVLTGLVFPFCTWYLFDKILLILLPTSPWFTWV